MVRSRASLTGSRPSTLLARRVSAVALIAALAVIPTTAITTPATEATRRKRPVEETVPRTET